MSNRPNCNPVVTLDEFQSEREKYLCGINRKPLDRNVIAPWLRSMVNSRESVSQCYRVLEADLEGDLLKGLTVYAGSLIDEGGEKRRHAQYVLRFNQRVLFANYAFGHALRMEKLLFRAGDNWKHFLWRVFAAYLMPRLSASILIGFAAVTGSDAMRSALLRLSSKDNLGGLWFALLLLFTFLLGMLDVERRVGRRWTVVLRRSFLLLTAGIVYSCVVGVGWMAFFSECLSPKWPFNWAYSCLSSATALTMAHIVQLFWHEHSIAEPM